LPSDEHVVTHDGLALHLHGAVGTSAAEIALDDVHRLPGGAIHGRFLVEPTSARLSGGLAWCAEPDLAGAIVSDEGKVASAKMVSQSG